MVFVKNFIHITISLQFLYLMHLCPLYNCIETAGTLLEFLIGILKNSSIDGEEEIHDDKDKVIILLEPE